MQPAAVALLGDDLGRGLGRCDCFGQDRLGGSKYGSLPIDDLALVEGLAVTGGARLGGDGKLVAAGLLSSSRGRCDGWR